MAITTNDLKNGMVLDLDGKLMQIVEFQHVKPGKGPAFVRTKIRNVRTGAVIEKTFRAAEKVERVTIDKREMQYLYRDGDDYVFMDNSSYEQLQVPSGALGDAGSYLIEGAGAVLQMHGDEIVGTDLPAAVELTVTETEPGIQGDRVSGATKPATLETGKVLQVPLFVNIGDRLRVDTRSGEYITRA
ncbi:MAG TPA: elongation factor P [Acidimicrobiales bacterium]|nr:elongation factor P [Acidimicrobiales bacterium]